MTRSLVRADDPPPRKDELGIPDMCFLLTEQSLFFDHRRRRLRVVANAFVDHQGAEAAYDAAGRE
jgi:anthranilate synthase component 1